MKTFEITKKDDINLLVSFLEVAIKDKPVELTVKDLSRSVQQNSLSHKWYAEIARARGDMTVNEVRAECKLVFGVPILRASDEKFRETYDRVLKPLPYETKVEFIERTELPVTSLMTTRQMTEYLDAVSKHFAGQGVFLTIPEAA